MSNHIKQIKLPNEETIYDIAVDITAAASDDDVVVLTGTNGTNAVAYDAKHAKKGPSTTDSTTKGATANVTVTAGAGKKTIKVPQVTVDTYGHTTGLTEKTLSITIPATPSSLKNPEALTVGTKTYDGSTAITITAADLNLGQAMKFIGTTTTEIADGNTTNSIVIDGVSIAATNGNVVIYGAKEFVWNGSAWEEFGNEGNYKVVQGPVASPSASGTATAFVDTISQNAQGVITATKKTVASATQSAAGLMSAEDKIKLDGIAIGATANTGDITAVTAGAGLTGGATSGEAALAVGAGVGIVVNEDSVALATSGVTAGTYGPSADVTGSNNATMNVPEITVDKYGRVTAVTNRVYTAKNTADTDKKTASSNTSSKIFLVGATTQSTSGQTTYSHDTVYVGTDGHLYDTDALVATQPYVNSAINAIQAQVDGKVPTSRTVNGKALSSNITLSASDVNALPNTTKIPTKTSELTNDSSFVAATDAQIVINSSDWSNMEYTANVSVATASNIVIIAPSPECQENYSEAGVKCVEQGAGTLKFTCTTVPTTNLTINVVAIN